MPHAALVGFAVKADSKFFEGLCATIASIIQWHPTSPITIIDCGLSGQQKEAISSAGVGALLEPDLAAYNVVEGSEEYYTRAVYGAMHCLPDLYDLTIHIDSDAILLNRIDELTSALVFEHGLAAVPDFPALGLDFQVGHVEKARNTVKQLIPNYDPTSVSFNGGVYAVRKTYFIKSMLPMIGRLNAGGAAFWGNEMALMNLAAFAANPARPFIALPQSYNHRPEYRRAPELASVRLVEHGVKSPPKLFGHFGRIRVLHFVGRNKPWVENNLPANCQLAWDYYRQLARVQHGLL